MAIHTFGEYLDFHPHLHALVADGLFDCEGRFHVMRAGERAGERVGEITRERTQDQRGSTDALCAGNHAALEQLFRARMLRSWVHSGFNVHLSRRIAPNECQDMERLAQYIVSYGRGL